MAKDLFIGCAEQLATSPYLVERLLDVHTSTTDGWCTGHQMRPERHPCSIRRLAELAAGYAAERPRIPSAPSVTSQHRTIAWEQARQGTEQPAGSGPTNSASSPQLGQVHQL